MYIFTLLQIKMRFPCRLPGSYVCMLGTWYLRIRMLSILSLVYRMIQNWPHFFFFAICLEKLKKNTIIIPYKHDLSWAIPAIWSRFLFSLSNATLIFSYRYLYGHNPPIAFNSFTWTNLLEAGTPVIESEIMFLIDKIA